MITVGLSFGYHDSSISIVKDGDVLYSTAEQHFTRQKHDPNFPAEALEDGLSTLGLSIQNVDHFVYHENPYRKFSRVLTSSLSGFPNTRREFVNSMKTWLGKRLWVFNDLCTQYGIPASKISYLNHHLSHAAQAFISSGFDDSGVLVVDAVGDWSSTSLYDCSWEKDSVSIRKVHDVQFPNSLGLLYSAFTSFLGFQPNSGECSVMALASFGKPTYLGDIQKLVAPLDSNGDFRVSSEYLNFTSFYSLPYTDRFVQTFGAPRSQHQKLPFTCLDEMGEIDKDSQRFADIASSIQLFFENACEFYLQKLSGSTKSKNLCLAGGGALNCVSNSKLKANPSFNNIYIPPDPGDGGTSFGVALYHQALNKACKARTGIGRVNMGGSCKPELISDFVELVNPATLKNHSKHGFERTLPEQWQVRKDLSGTELLDRTSKLLAEGRIVGWVRGRTELGPRALGYRSILLRPDRLSLAKRLSHEIKDRAPFRPYALSMTDSAAMEILDTSEEDLKNHRWMQYSVLVNPSYRKFVRAGLHVDGTTRPQVVFEEDNQEYYSLLSLFGQKTGGPEALINTSFNESGFPIVGNSLDALTVFARTSMDAIVIENMIIEKGNA